MVDISSGDKKINITVSTSGNKASVNATPDTAMYYSNKSREWAISDKIVDNEDYSSKYYANVSKQNAETVKNKITEVNNAVEKGITNIINQENISVDNVNTAGATQVNLAKEQATIATTQAGIATAKTSEVVESGNNAITAITEQETTSKNNIETKGAEQIELIQNEGATQVANVQSTGFYMRDDKLYFINSQGEETEFKSGGSGLEVCDIGMSLYVDETKGKRRYLNGQIVDRNANTEAFFKRLQEITTLYPSLLCTEDEWQAAKTLSAFGQVGKFVFNYADDGETIVSVRLPRVINVQGVFDLQNLGMTVEAGLPNITGTFDNIVDIRTASGAFYKRSVTNSTGGTNTYTVSNAGAGIDAHRSSSIYGNSTTVQPEAIQYPYFIQIATGSETENNIINDIELNNPYSLFDSKYSDHELNNLSWLKSEGQWNAKAAYTSAYDELLKEYNNPDRLATFNKNAFEVVGSPTITDDGVASGLSKNNYFKINEDIREFNKIILKGQYVWNGTNPTTSSFIYQIINDKLNSYLRVYQKADGAISFYINQSGNETYGFGNISILPNIPVLFTIEITHSSARFIVMQNNIIINDIKQDVDIALSDETNKAIIILGSLGNFSDIPIQGSIDLKQFSITVDGQRVFSGANSMVKLNTEDFTDYDFVLNTVNETFRLPLLDGSEDLLGTKYDNLTLLDSGSSYIAPANGWFNISIAASAAGNYLSAMTSTGIKQQSVAQSSGNKLTMLCPIIKGETITLGFNTTGAPEVFRFIYAQGNGSLYYYVGETVQNANLIDAGRIGEQLAGKADIDLANTVPSTAFIQQSVSWGVPDYSAGVSWSTSVNSTWTAPYDCYISTNLDQNSRFCVRKDNSSGVYLNYGYTPSGSTDSNTFPVPKGTKLYVVYLIISGNSNVTIYPLKGAN